MFYLSILAIWGKYKNLKFLEDLQRICQEYFDRMYVCESQKYDMEFECRKKDYEVPVGKNPGDHEIT